MKCSFCFKCSVIQFLSCFLLLQFVIGLCSPAYGSPPAPPPPVEHDFREQPYEKRGGFVSILDRDGDSRVSREEFDGPPNAFDFHDKNSDGYLSENERPLRPPHGHSPLGIRTNDRLAPPQRHPEKIATTTHSVMAEEVDNKSMKDTPAPLAAVSDVANVIAQVDQEASEKRWLLFGIISVFIALVLALGWGAYTVRRFQQMKEAVRSLNPHLLGVSVDNNIMITEVSEALCKATGFKGKDLVGKPLMALGSHTADNPNSMQEMWSKIKRGIAWKGEVKLIRKDGTVIWADAVISPSRRKKENPAGYTVIYQDASKRKHFEKLSTRDELTGLFNRRHFNEVSKVLLKKTLNTDQYYVLCLLDVDNFKAYNDTYGHPAGDQVLAAIGSTLTRLFQRRDDLAFRLGGEEFGGVIIVKDKDEAASFAHKVLQEIRGLQIPHVKNPPGFVTVSIGVNMVAGSKAGDIDAVYKKADQALYKAKQTGRNRIVAKLL